MCSPVLLGSIPDGHGHGTCNERARGDCRAQQATQQGTYRRFPAGVLKITIGTRCKSASRLVARGNPPGCCLPQSTSLSWYLTVDNTPSWPGFQSGEGRSLPKRPHRQCPYILTLTGVQIATCFVNNSSCPATLACADCERAGRRRMAAPPMPADPVSLAEIHFAHCWGPASPVLRGPHDCCEADRTSSPAFRSMGSRARLLLWRRGLPWDTTPRDKHHGFGYLEIAVKGRHCRHLRALGIDSKEIADSLPQHPPHGWFQR